MNSKQTINDNASLDSVRQKLYRAAVHARELKGELASYYKTSPGRYWATNLPNGKVKITHHEKAPTPKRFGLIFGDCLQSIRSALDYLVWELVLANNGEPDKNNMFPICTTTELFTSAVQKKRLRGVHPSAVDLIEHLQPFHNDEPALHLLAVLDYLTNIGKHRRILLTAFKAMFHEPPSEIPHVRSIIKGFGPEGESGFEQTAYAYLALNEVNVPHLPITLVVERIYDAVHGIVDRFEDFFPNKLRSPKVSHTQDGLAWNRGTPIVISRSATCESYALFRWTARYSTPSLSSS